MAGTDNLKEEKFNLTHSFRGFQSVLTERTWQSTALQAVRTMVTSLGVGGEGGQDACCEFGMAQPVTYFYKLGLKLSFCSISSSPWGTAAPNMSA